MSKVLITNGDYSISAGGNVNISSNNTFFSGNIVSTVSTGISPIQVASTTLVPNLYVERAHFADIANVTIDIGTATAIQVTPLDNSNPQYLLSANVSNGNAEINSSTLTFNPVTNQLAINNINVVTVNTTISNASNSQILFSGNINNLIGVLPENNANTGTFGSSTTIPVITVTSQGLITNISSVTISGGGGGTGNLGIISFGSASSLNFDATLGQEFKITLNSNVASSTFINGTMGPSILCFRFLQGTSGNNTFVWPANVRNGGDPNPLANSRSIQFFATDTDGSLDALGPIQYSF